MPCPTAFVVKNGSKTRGSTSGAMPGPLSSTSMRTHSAPVHDVAAHADADPVARHASGASAGAGRRRARPCEDGLLGIEHEVQDHLLQLMGVAIGGGKIGRDARPRLDAGQAQLGGAQEERLLDDLGQRHRAARRRALAGEEQQPLDDLGHPVALGHDELDGAADLGGWVPREHELPVPDHHRERIVELVGDAGDELAHRGELGRLHQLGLGAPAARAGARASPRRGGRCPGPARPGPRKPPRARCRRG